MIVISDALVATVDLFDALKRPIFCWDNQVTVANIVADEQDADFPATNLANPSTNSLWKATSTADQYITVTLSGTNDMDCAALARHNLGTGLCVISIEGITGDIGAVWTEIVAEQLLADDQPAVFLFEAAAYIGIRFKLQPDAVVPQAAVAHVSQRLTMVRGIPPGHTPINFGRSRETLSSRAQNGDFLGQIITSERLANSVEFKWLDAAWYRSTFQPFIDAAVPFFFAWAPVDYPRDVGYAWLVNDPVPVINRLNGDIDISMQLGAVAL